METTAMTSENPRLVSYLVSRTRDPDKSLNCVRQSLAEGTGWGGWQPCRRLPVMKKASHEFKADPERG